MDPKADLQLIEAMMAKGRAAVGIEGASLMLWGGALSVLTGGQYLAEIYDLGRSHWLWLWQPCVLGLLGLGLFLNSRYRRRSDIITPARLYRVNFSAALLTIAVFLIAQGLYGRPDPLASLVIVCATLCVVFANLASGGGYRWLYGIAAGWLALLAYFSARPQIHIEDMLVLAAAFAGLLFAPGLALTLLHKRAGA